MEIGNNLKKLRTQKGMTQKDLAESLNVSYQAVSRWENNEVEPDISTLSKLSSIFEVPVDAIINGNFENKDDEKQKAQEAAALAGAIESVAASKTFQEPAKKIKEYCYDCHKPIYEGDEFKLLNRNFSDGHIETQHICKDCFDKRSKTAATTNSIASSVDRKIIGNCSACGKNIYTGDKHSEVNVPASTSRHRGHTYHHGGYTKYYCERCDELRKRGKLNSDGSLPKVGKKRMIFDIENRLTLLQITNNYSRKLKMLML